MVGADMFDAMVAEIRDKTVRALLTVVPKPQQEVVRVQVAKPLIEGFEGGANQSAKKVTLTPKRSAKVGRNDPCPCGSGKKYKNCCGANPAAGNN
jgi:preprotein translocase subunit SecA